MKKIISALLSVLLLSVLLPTAKALTYPITAGTPGVSAATAADGRIYTVPFTAEEAAFFEEIRSEAREEQLRRYREYVSSHPGTTLTFAQYLTAMDAEWCDCPVEVTCAIGIGGKSYPVSAASPSAGSFRLSLFGDILPCLIENGAYGAAERNGFTFTLELRIVLNVNGVRTDNAEFGSTRTQPLTAPATAYIDYDVPEDAVNPYPVFLLAPYYNDININDEKNLPTRPGYVFRGWTTEDGSAIGRIPADTRYIKLLSHWESRTYQLRFVMTTREGYDFIKCRNPNPVFFRAGEGLDLYDASAPLGWVFAGWYTSPDFTGAPLTEIPAATEKDMVLYARWLTSDEALAEKIAAAHWGDLNSDGTISAADARIALRASVGLDKPSPEIIARGDFAGQGKLSADSARTLLRISVKLETIEDVLRRYGLL